MSESKKQLSREHRYMIQVEGSDRAGRPMWFNYESGSQEEMEIRMKQIHTSDFPFPPYRLIEVITTQNILLTGE